MGRLISLPSAVITDDSALGGSIIGRSLRFNRGDAPYLQATLGDGNEDKWTWSGWVKKTVNGQHQNLFSSGSDAVYTHINFDNNDRIRFQNWHSGQKGTKITTRVFRDNSAWMHIVVIWDSGNSTADDRIKIYVNGTRETSFSSSTNPDQNQDSVINGNSLGGSTYGEGKHFIGKFADTSDNSGTYKTEINFVDGYAYDPSYFGYTEFQTGIWRPKGYFGSYGTNGFRLDFSDNSATTAVTLGKDRSGQGNDFTPNNFSVSAGAGNDSVEDTPTNNFPTLNPLFLNATEAAGTFSEGNLKLVTTGSEYGTALSTFSIRYGKYYWEVKQLGGSFATHGIVRGSTPNADVFIGYDTNGKLFGFGYNQGGSIKGASGTGTTSNASLASSLATFTTNDIIGFASDISNGTLAIYKNNTLIYTITGINDNDWIPAVSGYTSNGSYSINFGQQAFSYTPPTGYKKLNSANLPPNAPSIVRPQKHFETLLWTGNGSTGQNITGLKFKPDLLWIKKRNASESWGGYDSVRGVNKRFYLNDSHAENTEVTMSAFFQGGFKVEGSGGGATNDNGDTYVGFCWKAGGATTVANTDGNQTTQVSVNEEAGLSIVTYTGTGSNTNIGHGLGGTPDIVITKSRSATGSWAFLDRIGNSNAEYGLFLNDNGGYSSYQGGTYWNDTLPTSTVFRVSSNAATNASGVTYVAYCWRSIPGFSQFGKYTGTGSNDGTFIYTGFRPAWVTVKNTSASNNWQTWDNARETSNVMQKILEFNDASTTDDASSNTAIDFLSNGFKHRTNFQRSNTDGATYLYMAFAEQSGVLPYNTIINAR